MHDMSGVVAALKDLQDIGKVQTLTRLDVEHVAQYHEVDFGLLWDIILSPKAPLS